MKLLTALFGALVAFAAAAQDLGIQGRTYPIAEPDMIEVIKARLQQKIDSGEFERYKEDAKARARESFVAPAPVADLAPAVERRVFFFDPSIRVDREVRAPSGALIVPAGTEVNPLDYAPFDQTWLFIDGREPKQLEWAKAQLASLTVKPIFVAGKWVDAWREWNRRTWFDMNGVLVRRLGITGTPAKVTASDDGRMIRIEEVPLD